MPLVNAPNSTVRPTWKDALRAPSASPMHRAPGHAAQDPSTRAAKGSDGLMPPITARWSRRAVKATLNPRTLLFAFSPFPSGAEGE